MKYFILILISVIVSSCNSQELEDYKASIAVTNKALLRENENEFLVLETEVIKKPTKVGPYYNRAEKIREITLKFYSALDSCGRNPEFDQKLLKQNYNSVINVLSSELDSILRGHIPNYLEPYSNGINANTPELMKTNVLLLENIIYKAALMQIDAPFCGVHSTNIEPLPGLDNSKQIFTFSSVYVSRYENSTITIDNVLLNGKKTALKPTIKREYVFASCEFDSLEPGNYEIQGRVVMIADGFYMVDGRPYSKKFTIK